MRPSSLKGVTARRGGVEGFGGGVVVVEVWRVVGVGRVAVVVAVVARGRERVALLEATSRFIMAVRRGWT